MGLGFAVLRLSPDALWRMTPRELAAAFGAAAPGRGRMDRASLDGLLRRFPDG